MSNVNFDPVITINELNNIITEVVPIISKTKIPLTLEQKIIHELMILTITNTVQIQYLEKKRNYKHANIINHEKRRTTNF